MAQILASLPIKITTRRIYPNSHFASDFHEEVPEVGGGGGEYHLVGGEGGTSAAGERHVREILAAENVSRQPENGNSSLINLWSCTR